MNHVEMKLWDRKSIPEMALELTPKFEANVLHPYRDSTGVWTIGIGSTVMPDGSKVTGGSPNLTLSQSLLLLGKQETVWAQVLERVVTVDMTETTAAVLIDFIHNEGPTAFNGSMIAKMMNAGYTELAAYQLPGWIYAKGQPLLGLARRREAERLLMLGICTDVDTAYNRAWAMNMQQLMPGRNRAYADAEAWPRILPAGQAATAPVSDQVTQVTQSTTDMLNDKSFNSHKS